MVLGVELAIAKIKVAIVLRLRYVMSGTNIELSSYACAMGCPVLTQGSRPVSKVRY